MSALYYQDDTVTLHTGDAAEVCATMPPQSVQCVVTSPPYYNLRDYGVGGQLGIEAVGVLRDSHPNPYRRTP